MVPGLFQVIAFMRKVTNDALPHAGHRARGLLFGTIAPVRFSDLLVGVHARHHVSRTVWERRGTVQVGDDWSLGSTCSPPQPTWVQGAIGEIGFVPERVPCAGGWIPR